MPLVTRAKRISTLHYDMCRTLPRGRLSGLDLNPEEGSVDEVTDHSREVGSRQKLRALEEEGG